MAVLLPILTKRTHEMAKTLVSKIHKDLWHIRGRALIVVAAMILGMFSVSWVLVTYTILTRELHANYLAIRPASATIWTSPFQDDLLPAIRRLPGVAEVQGTSTVEGRVQVGTQWRTLVVFVYDDVRTLHINKLSPTAGAWPLPDGSMLLERSALSVARAKIGDTLAIRLPGGQQLAVPLAGTLHDLSVAPAWQEGLVYGYINRTTLKQWSQTTSFTRLQLVVNEPTFDKQHIRTVTTAVTQWLQRQGYPIKRVEIPPPGEHPHQDQMDALLLLQQLFGAAAFLLSCLLIVTLISALLTQQIRDIAIMKAIGARSGQIMSMIFGLVFILGCVAFMLALPLGIWAGELYATFIASLLNFDIVDRGLSPITLFALILLILGTPLLAATAPILRGTRLTVRQALDDACTGKLVNTRWLLTTRLALPRPFLFSLRNTLRSPGRLILTLITLSIGGALFLAAMNINASFTNTIAQRFATQHYDLDVRFSQPYPAQRVSPVLKQVSGVSQVEGWSETSAALKRLDGTQGNTFALLAPPASTQLVQLPLVNGRWLRSDDHNALVVNHTWLSQRPGTHVGDQVTLNIHGEDTSWRIVGVVRQIATPPTAYTTLDTLSTVLHQSGTINQVRIVSQPNVQMQLLKKQLEERLVQANIEVIEMRSLSDQRQVIEDHSVVIVAFLLLMSLLSVSIGALAVATTMNLQVLERTRELGILRVLGATSRRLQWLVLTEGALMGALSCAGALLLTLPTSYELCRIFGLTLLETPLDFTFNTAGLLIWLGLAIGLALLASAIPAVRASRLVLRNLLAYE